MLVIRVRLVGLPIYRQEDVGCALADALARGIAVRSCGRLRIPLKAQGREVAWRGITWPEAGDCLRLRLITPLALRRRGSLVGSFATLPMVVFRRLHGRARWDGIEVRQSEVRLNELFAALTIVHEDLQLSSWRHASSNSRARAAPVRGIVGDLRFSGKIAPLFPLLAFAGIFHAGGGPALGLGRIEVGWW